jgi:cobalt/nickel transport system ATP-binding protein
MLMEFEGVEYLYPCSQQNAIADLTLRVPPSRRCAFIGRNGCGKTTLFRLANGLYRPRRGTIRWRGERLRYDRASLNRLRQQVGLVFQNPEQQLVALTVEEDLSYGLCNLGLPEAEIARRVGEALVDFDLVELADTPVNYLSLGQKKRVSIADVMVLQPQLLLLDEPTAYLDPCQTRNLLRTLEKISQTGATVAIATHDLNFVYSWADWVFVMDRGRLVLEGTPETVFAQREVMADLKLGIPLAMEVLDAVKAESGNWGAIEQRILQQLQGRS